MLDKQFFEKEVTELREVFYASEIPDKFFVHVYNLYKNLPEKNVSDCFQYVKEHCESRLPMFYHFRVAYNHKSGNRFV